MKKFFAIALAVSALSATAYAADTYYRSIIYPASEPEAYQAGDEINIFPESFYTKNSDGTANSQIPGEIDFTSEYFTITSKKFSKGSNLVKSIGFVDDADDGYVLQILIGDSMTDITSNVERNPEYCNLVMSELALKAKKTVKDADNSKLLSKGTTYYFYDGQNALGKLYAQVGVVFDDAHIISLNRDDIALSVSYDKYTSYKFKESGNNSYATVTIDLGDIGYLEGRVYDGDKVSYKYNQEANKTIMKAYPDAEIEFLNLLTKEYPAPCYFELYADEDEYVYKIENGKVTKSGLRWDDEVYAWRGKVYGPCSYAISDIPLEAAKTERIPTSQRFIVEDDDSIIVEEADIETVDEYGNVTSIIRDQNPSSSTSTGSSISYPIINTVPSSNITYPTFNGGYFNPETGR